MNISAAPEFAPTADRATHLDWLIVLGLPWILVVLVPGWYFNPPGTLDPWLYHGFLQYYPDYIESVFRSTYYGSRAAWLLPGHMFYRVLSPAVASLWLHVTLLTIALVLLHATLRRVVGVRAALFPTLLFGAYTGTLSAMGWDYPDGAVITYLIAVLYCITRYCEGDARLRWPLLAGAAFAGMVHSNLLALLFGPALMLPLLINASRDCFRLGAAARCAATFIAGSIAATVLLAIWNVAVGGMWLFFVPSLEFIRDNAAPVNRWRTPGLAWIARAPWAALPALGFVAAFLVWRSATSRPSPPHRATALVMMVSFASVALFDACYGALFQYSYYTSWFIPTAFIVIAAAGAWPSGPAATVPRMLAAGCCLALLLTSYMTSAPQWFASYASLRLPAAWVAAAVMALALAWGRRRPRTVVAVVITVGVVVFNLHLETSLGHTPPNPENTKAFKDVHATVDVIARHVKGERPYLWLGGDMRDAPLRGAVASMYLYGFTIIGERFPELPDQNLKELRPTSLVAIFTDRIGRVPEQAQTGLANLGFTTEVVETRRLDVGHAPHDIAILKVTARQAPGGTP